MAKSADPTGWPRRRMPLRCSACEPKSYSVACK